MLTKVEQFVKKYFMENVSGHDSDDDQKIMIATAVLFLEMAYADFKVTEEEEDQLRETLSDFFKLPEADVSDLIDLAREKRAERTDIWLFSNLIKEKFEREQKMWILEMLWKMIYIDNTVDKYEDNLIRKISNLIGLSHQDMIQAKIKATQ